MHLKMPPLNQYLGPWVYTGEGKYVTRLANEHRILSKLIEQLPHFDSFQQSFAPNIRNWLPFHWAGFDAAIRYTYRLDDLADIDALWNGFRENIRREVRKATKLLAVRDDLGIQRFIDVYAKTFERQSRQLPFSRDLIARVDEACREHSAGKALFAVDAHERIHSAVYYVWSTDTCFYLMSGADPELRTSGATSLLVWEGIKRARRVSASFDFEGSMVPSLEKFVRGFGARQTPYFRVVKYGRRIRAAKSIKELWHALRPGR